MKPFGHKTSEKTSEQKPKVEEKPPAPKKAEPKKFDPASVGTVLLASDAILVETPSGGGHKSFSIPYPGIWILSESSGILQHLLIGRAGLGDTIVWDDIVRDETPGKTMFRFGPGVFGHFPFGAGFSKGLVIECSGSVAPLLTVVWSD